MDFREAAQATKIGIGGASDHYTRLFAQKMAGRSKTVIYGYHVNPAISDPTTCITYLADARGMTPCGMDFARNKFNWGSWKKAFFMPKPCMVKFDGTVDYYLDQDDYSKKEDGTASDATDENYGGNAMMEWPLIWFKIVPGETDGEADVYISNEQADENYHCWSNVNSKNEIIDHFYTAIYQGTGTAKLRSLSGVALTQENGNGNTTVTEEVARATANNTTADVEWYTETYSDYTLICMLLTLISKSLDSEVFGRGVDTGGQTAKEAYITGTLDNAGMFYGTNTGTGPVKTFGMENFWGLAWHRVAGFITVNDVESRIKWTYGTADGTTATAYNQNGSGYLIGPQLPQPNGYVKTMEYGSVGIVPATLGASMTTHYCDYFYQKTGTRYLLCGGASSTGRTAGRWYRSVNFAASYRGWSIGASLSLKPLRRG